MGDSVRLKKIESSLREAIATLIVEKEIKDPRISTFASITKVEVAKDLSFAKAYVSSFEGGEKVQQSVDGLNSASGFIQKRIGKFIRMRFTPKLLFVADNSIEQGIELRREIEQLVKDE